MFNGMEKKSFCVPMLLLQEQEDSPGHARENEGQWFCQERRERIKIASTELSETVSTRKANSQQLQEVALRVSSDVGCLVLKAGWLSAEK